MKKIEVDSGQEGGVAATPTLPPLTTMFTLPMIWGVHNRAFDLFAGDGSGSIPDATFDCFNGDRFYLCMNYDSKGYSLFATMEDTVECPRMYYPTFGDALRSPICMTLGNGLLQIRFFLTATAIQLIGKTLLSAVRPSASAICLS